MEDERNMEDMEDETILLVDEEGNEHEFIVDDEFTFEDKNYIVLIENEDDDDAMLFRVDEDENGEMVLTEVEDDDEFNRVSEFYFEE